MKKPLGVLSIMLFVTLISGCTEIDTPRSTSAQNSNESSPATTDTTTSESIEPSGVDSFIPIGKKVKIRYLQHTSDNLYQLGLRNTDRTLVWYDIRPEAVYLQDDIEVSYIERIADTKDSFGISRVRFILHIKEGTSNKGDTGGDGENGDQDILSDMIIGGGSW